MQTLVIQSYRTRDVAAWIHLCLGSVQTWAAAAGYQYEFVDDRLFDYAPGWVREHCGKQLLPITDVARMRLLRERLEQGWERVVWVDADVLVFAPERFVLDGTAPYSLCEELWLRLSESLEIHTEEKVNNAVMTMTRGHPMLDFWIFAVEEILRVHAPHEIGPLTASTQFFTELAHIMPLRVLRNVGLLSPPVVRDIGRGGGTITREWARQFGHPIGAANLCASLQDKPSAGAIVGAAEMQDAVDVLLRTRGAVLNAHLDGMVSAA
jgi:hypothetical protein